MVGWFPKNLEAARLLDDLASVFSPLSTQASELSPGEVFVYQIPPLDMVHSAMAAPRELGVSGSRIKSANAALVRTEWV